MEKNLGNVATALEVACMKYIDNKDEIEKREANNKALSPIILDYLDQLNTKSYTFFDNDAKDKFTFSKAERSKVMYDVDKVKAAVGKKMFAKISDRKIEADWNKLVELAKKYSIPKDEIMDCITVIESVNSNKVKQLYDIGEIDLNSLKGTFTMDSTTYLTMRKTPNAK